MSRLLRELLHEKEPEFTIGLSRLEKISGMPSIDVRLTGEIQSLAHAKVAALGLDPSDTTGSELYAALKAEILKTDEHIRGFLGNPASGDELVAKIVSWVSTYVADKQVWGVKDTSIKAVFKKNPPKAVMKAFHFTSLESMLKRLPMSQALIAARIVESKTWWSKTHKLYSAMSHKDFQRRPLECIELTDAKWLPLLKKWSDNAKTPIVSCKELGVVGVGYVQGPCSAALLMSLALHYANEVLIHGAFLKLHFVHPSQGQVLVDMFDDGGLISGSVSSNVVHWRDVQRFFGLHIFSKQINFAHLETSDLEWLRAEVILASYVPELSFWAATDFIGVSYGPGKNISMNLHDVACNVNNGLFFTRSESKYLVRSLRSELMARYVKEPAVRALALKLFDISGIVEEDW
jgi:hypothetical protein